MIDIEKGKKDLLSKTQFDEEDLYKLVRILRSQTGCPWDREQTHASLRPCLLEEAYETAEGIDRGDDEMLCEELGDLLLQIVFHAVIAEENGEFDRRAITSGVCQKMLRRHPHVFGEEQVDSAEEMKEKWDLIKSKTEPERTVGEEMDHIAKTLPALVRAQKVAKKADRASIAVPCADEMNEKALGEQLFALCVAAQRSGLSAEDALTKYQNRLISSVLAQEKIAENVEK